MKKPHGPGNTVRLVETIVEGIRKKKGEEIVSLDFTNIENKICDFFIICHSDSNIQVNAIADSIERNVRAELKEKVWQKGGYENSYWVILDYVDVVVHVFQKEYRDLYKLENLWADTIKIEYE